VRRLALTLTLSDKDAAQLANPAVYTTFSNCQRLTYTCTAHNGGSSSLQALHLALRKALPHLSQLEAVVVEVGEDSSAG
jgi:hypothetical protein